MMNKKTMKELLNFSIINIDKPSGPTSFSVSEYVKKQIRDLYVFDLQANQKKLLGLKKTSHFGTLDPKVTGVLPVALGRACKFTGFFLGHNKEYVGIMHTHKEQDMKKLQEVINKDFVGKIKQLPPKKSRVKREERIREVKSFKLLEQGKNNKDFLFQTEVQGGTYIRKLIHDLGEKIGGAHMLELRRIRAGIFKEKDSVFVSLYQFKEAVDEFKKGNENKLKEMLTPAESAVKKIMPFVQVKQASVKQLLTGKPLFKKDIIGKLPKESDIFAVFCGERFIEIAHKVKEIKIKQMIARPNFVFN